MGSKHPRSSKQNHVFSQSRSWKCLSTRQIGKSQIAAVRFAGFDDEVPTLKTEGFEVDFMIPPLNASICQVFVHISGAPDLEKDMEWSRYERWGRCVVSVPSMPRMWRLFMLQSKSERSSYARILRGTRPINYQPLINTHYSLQLLQEKSFNDMCIAGADTWIYYIIYCMTQWCGPEDMCQHYLAWHCVVLDSLVRLSVGFLIAATWSFLMQPNNRSSNFSWSWTFLYYLTSWVRHSLNHSKSHFHLYIDVFFQIHSLHFYTSKCNTMPSPAFSPLALSESSLRSSSLEWSCGEQRSCRRSCHLDEGIWWDRLKVI